VESLALATIASGAFSAFLLRRVMLEDVAGITAEQTAELAVRRPVQPGRAAADSVDAGVGLADSPCRAVSHAVLIP